MKNRFSTFGRHASRALCLMTFCGLVWACKDEYTLDDEKPTWLSANIYSYLEEKGNFNNYLRLLEDKDVNPEGVRNLKDVLSKTGSKTIFVATDEAWDQFYQRNAKLPVTDPWHNATSYENLSPSQKKLLIHCSMLNNAIVMENLSASDGTGSSTPIPGQYMRRYTDVDVIDTVTYLPAEQVPYTYNTEDKNYWVDFRPEDDGGNGKGIYLVMDATRNMMLHFTREHMGRGDILVTDEDFEKIMGETRLPDDVHVYNARLIQKDSVTENGYVNVVDKVIAPLANMAEVIRTNGRTNIFSHMLDRFSYPSPNTSLTEQYKNLTGFTGMVYTKKYFALRGEDGKVQKTGPDGVTFKDEVALQFDPGWNEYKEDSKDEREDIATMFVPNDATMLKYFSHGGGGWQLVETYATDIKDAEVNNFDDLYKKIDRIPLNTLAELLNVIMFPSFVGSVPSKITTLRDNRSQEEMFTPDDINYLDTCLLACNGAVYVMNKVYGPASYTSVVGPANISKTNLIMQWAINNGTDYTKDKMHMSYYAYLMAMRSWFTFFLPSDEALKRYYDPVSFTSNHPRVIKIEMTPKKTGNPPLQTGKILYPYDVTTGLIDEQNYRTDQLTESELLNRLRDVLESHTIVHEDGIHIDKSSDEYYLAKNGAGLKITKQYDPATDKWVPIKVQGGFQLENERDGMVGGAPGTVELNLPEEKRNEMLNGHTIILEESPIIPASKSIYHAIHEEFADDCTSFYALTDMSGNSDIIKACGLDLSKLGIWKGQATGAIDQNVGFLSNFNYTVFVPTNEAIDAAEAAGLPTWTDIRADYESLPVDPEDEDKRILTDKDKERLQAKITYLNNFIRCHFVDGSVFEDKSTFSEEKECETSSYDSKNGVFVKVFVNRENIGGETRLTVRDFFGGGKRVTTGTLRNIMTRDMTCELDPNGTGHGDPASPTGRPTLNNIVLQTSSFAVVHQIDDVLSHIQLPKRSDGTDIYPWDDDAPAGECKRYLKRFSILSSNDSKKMKRHE